jgi:hypothetical protein
MKMVGGDNRREGINELLRVSSLESQETIYVDAAREKIGMLVEESRVEETRRMERKQGGWKRERENYQEFQKGPKEGNNRNQVILFLRKLD